MEEIRFIKNIQTRHDKKKDNKTYCVNIPKKEVERLALEKEPVEVRIIPTTILYTVGVLDGLDVKVRLNPNDIQDTFETSKYPDLIRKKANRVDNSYILDRETYFMICGGFIKTEI